jgi:hypothetical protein
MKQRTSHILYSYWNEARGDRLAPRRFDIEPSRIAEILPQTFIIERSDHETFPFRIAGSRISEYFGVEHRGTNFLADWTDEDRVALISQLATVCNRGGVLLADIEAAADYRRRVTFEICILPLVHTDNAVNRLVGCFSPMESPAWLGSVRLWRKRLLAHEILWPEGRPHVIADKWRAQAPVLTSLASARLIKNERRTFRVLDGGLATKIEDGGAN